MVGGATAEWATHSSSLANDGVVLGMSQLDIDEESKQSTPAHLAQELKAETGVQDTEATEQAKESPKVDYTQSPPLNSMGQGFMGLNSPNAALSSLTVTPPFILKLSSMVSTKEFEHLVSWGSTGETVLVKDLRRFSNEVLPKYFKHKNFTSFLRQLNMYGFHTLHQGDNWREFKNSLFKKSDSHNYVKIKRKTNQNLNKGNTIMNSTSKPLKATKPKKPGEALAVKDSSSLKESKKRKKDVFKGKNPKEIENAMEVIQEQQEQIGILKQRCETNEARIETLEESLASMRAAIRQLREAFEKPGMVMNSHSQSTQSSAKRPIVNDNPADKQPIAQNTSLDFDPSMSDIANELLNATPNEGRGRTLSDTILSVGPFNPPSSSAMFLPPQNTNLLTYDVDRYSIDKGQYMPTSFDDISLLSSRDFFGREYPPSSAGMFFSQGNHGKPKKSSKKQSKSKQRSNKTSTSKKPLTSQHQTTNENIKSAVEALKPKRKKKWIRLVEEAG